MTVARKTESPIDTAPIEPGADAVKTPLRSARQLRRKRAPKALGPALLVVAVVAIAGYLIWSAVKPSANTTRYTTSTVEKGTLTVAASGNGSVVVGKASSVSPQVSGVVANLQVSLGDKVKAGQKLFTIVNDDYDDQVTQALAQYKNAKASLIGADQRVTSAEQNVTQAQGQVLQAQLQLTKAQQDHDTISAKPGATANEISNAEDQIEIAETSLKAAKQGLAAAKQGLDAAESSYAASKTSRDSAYDGYQQAIKTAAKRTVTAPIDGVVTSLNIQDGDSIGGGSSSSSSSSRASSAGSTGSSGSSGSSSAALEISDLGTMEVEVSVSEVDRAKIKVGQKASLTFDAVSDLTLTGKVTSIDAVGTNSSGVVTYNVTIAFDSLDERIMPGMTTAAAITTDVRTDVISVPRSAVKSDSSGSYVLVMENGATTPSRVSVDTGVSNDTNTEITSGLNAGQTIVTQVVTPTTSSSSSSGGNRGGFGGMGGGGVRVRAVD